MKIILTLLAVFASFLTHGQQYQFEKLDVSIDASFRALSVVDNNVIWVSGTDGQVGRSIDGGKKWVFNQVVGFEKSDFRSLYAFDSLRALIANAGSPANILLTIDGGVTWKIVYTNTHADAFFDGIDFWNNKEGVLYGDPIDGKMLLLRTADGGLTWAALPNAPSLHKGEASFAASGTGIRCLKKNEVMISTGGAVSRLWSSVDKGERWQSITVPILQGEASHGIFSFSKSDNALIVVGGDYKQDSLTTAHNLYSTDGGKNWLKPNPATRGYRECVEIIAKNSFIAIGPSGADISHDSGITWRALSDEKGLHVIRKARRGSLLVAAGSKGSLFLIK